MMGKVFHHKYDFHTPGNSDDIDSQPRFSFLTLLYNTMSGLCRLGNYTPAPINIFNVHCTIGSYCRTCKAGPYVHGFVKKGPPSSCESTARIIQSVQRASMTHPYFYRLSVRVHCSIVQLTIIIASCYLIVNAIIAWYRQRT